MVYTGCGETNQDAATLKQATSTILPIASSFVFPVRGKMIIDITKNIADPRSDGWKVDNYFGHWCDDCGGWKGYHPGEDWNLACADGGGKCDFDEPVYAVADGLVTYAQKYPGEDIGDAIVIEHQLPNEENLSKYILPDTVFPTSENPVSRIIESGYLHLQSLQITKGQMVRKGQMIARIGFEKSPHLHFEIRWKTGNTVFAGYKPTHQALTDRGLLVPTAFILAHTNPPFIFTPKDGENPVVCKTEPIQNSNSKIECAQTAQAPRGAMLWGAIQLEQVKKNTCFAADLFKNGTLYNSSPATCIAATETNIRKQLMFLVKNRFDEPGTWRIDYKVGPAEYDLKKISSSLLTISPTSSPKPPAPPPSVNQGLYTFAGVKATCDQPFVKTNWWEEYSCPGNTTPVPYGRAINGLVKLHYLDPNLRYRFTHELYYNGDRIGLLDDHAWHESGSYGQDMAYAFPRLAPEVIGHFPEPGTWTIRSFIAIEGKFTNWITDQSIVVF